MSPELLRLLFPKRALWDAVRLGRVLGQVAVTNYRLIFWPWLPK